MTLTMQEIAANVGCTVNEAFDASIDAQCGPWLWEGDEFRDAEPLLELVRERACGHLPMTPDIYIDLCGEKLRRLAFWLDCEPAVIVGERKGVAA